MIGNSSRRRVVPYVKYIVNANSFMQVKRSLKTLREKQDARGCLGVLETCIRSNFAAVESSRYGTFSSP